jgi:pimeloyl-ACP methyl ester carboxylesterase
MDAASASLGTSIHLVAQSMGGVLAARLAIEQPQRVATLVLCATSGGVDVKAMGGADWRAGFRAELPHVPDWFERHRTDLTARLGSYHCVDAHPDRR